MEKIELRPAVKEEANILAKISKEAFDTDVTVGAEEAGGPPDYDSVSWHQKMIKDGHLYTLLSDGEIAGGIILFRDERDKSVMYVGRIFIDVKRMRTGLGKKAMLLAEKTFPEIKFWRLDTPVWNVRTNNFYVGLGYKEMNRDEESVFFQKEIVS